MNRGTPQRRGNGRGGRNGGHRQHHNNNNNQGDIGDFQTPERRNHYHNQAPQTEQRHPNHRPRGSPIPNHHWRGRGGGHRGRGGGRGGYPNQRPATDPRHNRRPHHQQQQQQRRNQPVFAEHWTRQQAEAGLADGSCIKANLRINSKNSNQAFVPCARFAKDIFIDGRQARNRAFHGDTVVVKLLSEELWRQPKKRELKPLEPSETPQLNEVEDEVDEATARAQEECADFYSHYNGIVDEQRAADAARGIGNMSLNGQQSQLQPLAVVVHIWERASQDNLQIGFLKPNRPDGTIKPNDTFVRFVSVDRKVAFGLFPTAQAPKEFLANPSGHTTMYQVRYRPWLPHHRLPMVDLVKPLGMAGDIEVETEALLLMNDITHTEDFSEEVLECVRDLSDWSTVPADELARRRDLRQMRIFSIDPPTARDLDDCLSIERHADGTATIGVHIADVTHFLKPGTALDREARYRATSVYCVQKVIPMLPRILCEKLCSLNPGVERLAFSMFIKLDSKGQLVQSEAPWFGRTVIRSCAKMDYGTVQEIIDGNVTRRDQFPQERLPHPGSNVSCGDIIADCLALHKIALQRREWRFATGSLALNKCKLSFELDEECLPLGTRKYITRHSNHLVEEFMLLANQMVANQLVMKCGKHSLLRRHPPPLEKRAEEIGEFCSAFGYRIDTSSAGALHRSLRGLQGVNKDGVCIRDVVETMLTAPMKPAEYFCTGRVEMSEWRHYALNFATYTHFTSPIRRYADVVVHRMLMHSLEPERESLPSEDWIAQTSESCNERKMASKKAQDQSQLVFLCCLLKGNPRQSKAVIVDMGERSFKVLLPEYALDRSIYLDDIQKLDECQGVQIQGEAPRCKLNITWTDGKSSSFRIFDQLPVEIAASNSTPIDLVLRVLKTAS